MKVIFLDIDGVLNCRFTKGEVCGFVFVMDSKIELLKQLIEETGARIVLSSTWREGFYDMQKQIQNRNVELYLALKDKLWEFGLEILDFTPEIVDDNRGAEIDKWLREWDGEQIESFVILDDISGCYLRPHASRLVQTSFNEGLKLKHIERAKLLLSKSMDVY